MAEAIGDDVRALLKVCAEGEWENSDDNETLHHELGAEILSTFYSFVNKLAASLNPHELLFSSGNVSLRSICFSIGRMQTCWNRRSRLFESCGRVMTTRFRIARTTSWRHSARHQEIFLAMTSIFWLSNTSTASNLILQVWSLTLLQNKMFKLNHNDVSERVVAL